MQRWQISFAGLLALAMLVSGCALNRAGNPFAAKGKKPSDALADQKSLLDQPPSGKTGADAMLADRMNARDRSTAEDASAKVSEKPPGGGSYGGHDPKTLAYIESELRDATPEERAAMMANLRGLHPEAVRQILRGRRMGLNFKQQELAAAARNSGQPVIQPASAEALAAAAAAGGRRNPAANGLGSTSAWSRETDINRATVNLAAAAVAAQNAEAWSQASGDAVPPSGAPAVGRTSGYRTDADSEALPADNYSLPAAGAPAIRRVGPPGGPPGAGQFQVATATGAAGAPANRGPIPNRGAVVSAGTPMEASPPPQSGSASAALVPPVEASGRDYLAKLISATESEALQVQPGETETQKQAYVEKQVYLRMLYLMSGQQERALQAIPGIDPADQEFWQQTFWGLANYFDVNSIPASADRAAQTVAQLTSAVLRLQEKANLELRNVSFCHKISSFGNYEKFARDEFSPGQEVLLYAEVVNTHSEPVPDGKFRTSLKSTIEIYRHGAQGELIERIDLPETIDVCRTHRRDYFHSYQFTIPTKLSLGPHVLKLSVEDQLSRRIGTYTLNFTVK